MVYCRHMHGNRSYKRFMLLAAVLIFAFGAPHLPLRAQETDVLQQQLQEIERQIAQGEAELEKITGQKNTLTNKISQLAKQQHALNLQIKASDLRITAIERDLAKTRANIRLNEKDRERLRSRIADLLHVMARLDSRPPFYALITTGNIFDTLNDLQETMQVSHTLNETVDQAVQLGMRLDKEEQTLAAQEDEAQNLLNIRLLQQQELKRADAEQKTLLAKTRGQEQEYQAVLKDRRARAAEVRNRMYQLLGIGTQVTFGQAVQTAQRVAPATGVRPAFLLAILTQESNLGSNVGTCNRPGDPATKSWRIVMKPDRDQEIFVSLMQELKRDPDITPVSCPMHDARGRRIGWGGAMGPAQFIPSTWVGYRNNVMALTGKTSADPWDIGDAFAATALKVAHDGAAEGTRQGEWNAAMRYFSGSTNRRFRFYGDDVLKLADRYQADIDAL